MPIIQRPDLVAKIRKKYELTGPDAVSTISPELVPVVILENLAEQDPGDSKKYCAGGGTVAAAVNVNYVHLYNPVGSGMEIRLRRFRVGVSSSRLITLRYSNGMAGTTPYGAVYNRNLGQSGTPAALLQFLDTAVPQGAAIGGVYCLANTSVLIEADHNLPEGEGFMYDVGGTPGSTVYWLWEEIPV